MKLTPIKPNIETYPADFHHIMLDAKIYDSSCSPEARVIYIDKHDGYFLKSAQKGKLERQTTMMRFFHGRNLSTNVIAYLSDEQDWLLTEKIHGEDCISAKYLEQPKRLCDTIAENLVMLHSMDFSDCPEQNHTAWYLNSAKQNKIAGTYNKDEFPDSFGYASAEEAWAVVKANGHLLKCDTLLHGDYCLPNIILNDWKLAGFIDLDNAGVGDKHVDIFWAIWSLFFNLHTHDYRKRFIDAYGRDKIDEEMLRVIAAIEVFG